MAQTSYVQDYSSESIDVLVETDLTDKKSLPADFLDHIVPDSLYSQTTGRLFSLAVEEYERGLQLPDGEALFVRSLKKFNFLRKQGNQSAVVASYIGSCLFNLKRYLEAVSFLEESAEKGDFTWQKSNLIGTCYLKQGEYEKALKFLLKSEELGSTNPALIGKLAECYFGLGEYEKGMDEYERRIALFRHDFNQYWMHTLDHSLERGFYQLTSDRGLPNYKQLLDRFRRLYETFKLVWQERARNIFYCKLLFGPGSHVDKISQAYDRVA